MGCCKGFMKFVLIIINLIFFLGSGLMLAFGITGKANPDLIQKIFSKILPSTDQDHLRSIGIDLTQIVVDNSTFMIIIGVVGLVISLFGFIGACCMIRWMLVSYAIVLLILLLGEIALIIFAAVYSDSFKDTFQKAMLKTLTEGFKKEITTNGTSIIPPTGAVELSWATIQLKYKCCGAYNYTDYKSLANWNHTIGPTSPFSNATVPISCCKTKADLSLTDPTEATYSSFSDLDGCIRGISSYINEQNCFDALHDEISKFIRDYKGIAIGIAAGICGLELILIVFSFYLCSRVGKNDGKYV